MELVDRIVPGSPPPWPYSDSHCNTTRKYIYLTKCCQDHSVTDDLCKLVIYRYNMLSHIWKKLDISFVDEDEAQNADMENTCGQKVWNGSHILSMWFGGVDAVCRAILMPLSGPDRGEQLPLQIQDLHEFELLDSMNFRFASKMIHDPRNPRQMYTVHVRECCNIDRVVLAKISIDPENRSFKWNFVKLNSSHPRPLPINGTIVARSIAMLGSIIYIIPSYCVEHEQADMYLKVVYELNTEENTWKHVETLPDDTGNWPEVSTTRFSTCIGGVKGSNKSPDQIFVICGPSKTIWALNLSSRKWSRCFNANYVKDVAGQPTVSGCWSKVTEIGSLHCCGYYQVDDVTGEEALVPNKVTRLWLKPPTMKRSAMEKLLTLQPQLITTPANELRMHGVPPDVIELLLDEDNV